MLRRLLISFFILANLSAQAGVAYACEMMGEVVAHHCCCHTMQISEATKTDQSMMSSASCCAQHELSSDQGISDDHAKAFAQLSQFDSQLQQVAVLLAMAFPTLESDNAATEFSPPPDTFARFGTLTYLHTQRLRI